jgi:sialidase-1
MIRLRDSDETILGPTGVRGLQIRGHDGANRINGILACCLVSAALVLTSLPRWTTGQEPAKTPATWGVEKIDLFRAGEDGYAMYRIPGIVITSRGTILVYCEARAGHGDWTRQDVMLRRSTDGGRTWSPPRKMAEAPADLAPNPAAASQGLERDNKLTAHNALAIADAEPGVVHFLYHVEYARIFYRRSDDDGDTWSAPREITSVLDGFRDRYDWQVVGNGCGHAIQLRHGPHRGRLLLAVWLSTGTGNHAHRPSDVAVIYSDDRGATWQCGDFIARNGDLSLEGDQIVNPSETMLVELTEGRVLANLRTESPRNRRLLSLSPNGHSGWSKPKFHEDLLEPICMGSMVRLDDEGTILFSNPDNLLVGNRRGASGRNRDRRNVTIKRSDDGGDSWRTTHVVESGPGGYSDLAVGPGGTIYCFYERGAVQGNHYHTKALTLALLSHTIGPRGLGAPSSAGQDVVEPRGGAPLDAAAVAAPPAEKPNVLFILADDLGWADLGCYGNRFIDTPRIDRLAADGMRFTDAYAAAPVCAPTPGSIVSGQYWRPARPGSSWASPSCC